MSNTYSPFVMTSREASDMLNDHKVTSDNRCSYMLHVILSTVYGGESIPQSTFKKLPRLINGIPMGAGILTHTQTQGIQWRYLEGSRDMFTFVSSPMSRENAEESRDMFRNALRVHAQAVFSDITVKATVLLNQCVSIDSDMYLNDIAEPVQEGLHFKDT